MTKAARSRHPVILCCGNMDRGDDGVGLVASAELQERGIPALSIHGETSEFLEHFRDCGWVIVVDAMVSGTTAPGTIHRLEGSQAQLGSDSARASTHGMGLSQAMALAPKLGCAPARVVLFGVEAGQFEWSEGLSPEVAAALPSLVAAVEAEYRRLQEEMQGH